MLNCYLTLIQNILRAWTLTGKSRAVSCGVLAPFSWVLVQIVPAPISMSCGLCLSIQAPVTSHVLLGPVCSLHALPSLVTSPPPPPERTTGGQKHTRCGRGRAQEGAVVEPHVQLVVGARRESRQEGGAGLGGRDVLPPLLSPSPVPQARLF